MYKEMSGYVFFDGVKEKNVSKSYDDWLSTSDFQIYTKSYVKVNSEVIYLFGENRQKMEGFYQKNKKIFYKLNEKLNFLVEESGSEENKIFSKKYKHDDYYVLRKKTTKKEYLVFYSLGGSRFVESINIYGVFILNT